MDKKQWGVHIAHCCVLHGCKYGDEDRPVESRQVDQKYFCEWCNDEGIESVAEARREERKEEIEAIISLNACPYCGDQSEKNMMLETSNHDYMLCIECDKAYTIVYKRIPVDIILSEDDE